MRTTIDIPDDLFRAAKKKAADNGEKLKDVYIRALEREVGVVPARKGHRVKFPLIHSDAPGTVRLTNEDIADILHEDEVDRYRRAFQ